MGFVLRNPKTIIVTTCLTLWLSSCLSLGEAAQTFTKEQSEMLEKIKTAARDSGLPSADVESITKFDKDICYEDGCLDAALEIMSATNFSVDPCIPDKWVDYVCARRIFKSNNKQNDLGQIAVRVDRQTTKFLEEDNRDGKSSDFLLREAQVYFQQCKNKEANDVQDVKDILKYLQDKYGPWPIFANKTPSAKFSWLDMVADMNHYEQLGFKPFFLRVNVPSRDINIKVDVGRTSLPFTDDTLNDYVQLVNRVQKKAALEYPAITPQVNSAIRFLAKFDSEVLKKLPHADNLTRDEYTLDALQTKTNEYLKMANISSDRILRWKPFLERVLDGSNIKLEEKKTTIELPFVATMEMFIYVENQVNGKLDEDGKTVVANTLYLELASLLLHETTTLLDDLSSFRAREESGTRKANCLVQTQEAFGYALSKTYLRKFYDDPKVTPVVEQMMANIQKGYIHAVETREWMSNETKTFVTNKLRNITTFVAQTDWMKTPNGLKEYYKGLKASTDINGSHPLNFLAVNKWHVQKKRSWARKFATVLATENFSDLDIDDVRYNQYLAVANAAYYKLKNQILINVGILQKPLFGAERPGFMNYGGLGMVLGHEIGHSLDTSGRRFDTAGNLGEWWDKNSAEQYRNWTNEIATLYGNTDHVITKNVTVRISGYDTIDEDIADSLGIYVSFYSYKSYLDDLKKKGKAEKVLPGLKGVPPEKLFYMKYGNMWCEEKDVQDKYNRLALINAVHSHGIARATLPLKLSQEWHDSFKCKYKLDKVSV